MPSFFHPFVAPHQKFLMRLVISSQRVSRILKQLMEYVGIAWATTFIEISFLAFGNSLSFHPTSFFANFSLISLKVFFLFFPTKDGRPRYFSCCLITCALNMTFISSWISFVVLLLRYRDAFTLFSCWLGVCLYSFKTCCRVTLFKRSFAENNTIICKKKM